MKQGKILVVGSLVMDLTTSTRCFPERGATVLGTAFQTAPGGKGANQAVQAARIGADVTMVGRVGNDVFGNALRESAQQAGIDIHLIKTDENEPSAIGNVMLEMMPDGNTQNRIIVVPGANMAVKTEDLEPIREDIGSFDAIMLQLEIPMYVNEHVALLAQQAGVPVILNPAPAAALSDSLLRSVTYLTPNETEASALTGVEIRRSGNTVDLDDAERAADVLLEKGVQCVIMTLGSAGALCARKDQKIIVPAVPNVHAVDPTAAGDSFLGAFAAAISGGVAEVDAICFANCVAAITVSKHGAQPSLPKWEEVLPLAENTYGHAFVEKLM